MKKIISQFWNAVQGRLFPWIEMELGPLTVKQQELITTLELIDLNKFFCDPCNPVGRPSASRRAIARAFIAKAIYNMPTTRALIDRLKTDINLRRICGWDSVFSVPEEWTFSRAFSEFSKSKLPEVIHETLVKKITKDEIISHASHDSTQVNGREKPLKKAPKEKSKKKKGRPKKGEERKPPEPKKTELQLTMTKEEMLASLPKECDVGAKKNSKGNSEIWIGYKAHISTIDGDIPISCILTSASVHDSQVAIPLETISSERAVYLYSLMDAAYDSPEIKEHSINLGHCPLIDKNPRRDTALKYEMTQENKAQKTLNWKPAEKIRYNQRTSAERVNARLKDDYGGRMVRVRGYAKVACHIMFGLLALTADQFLKIAR